MAYMFYLDKMLLPVAPSKLQLKISNQNKTMTLINEGEVNVLKTAGLTDVEFEALLPNVKYPFSIYKNGFKPANEFLEKLKKLKQSSEPFQFIVSRQLPSGKVLFATDMKVSLEEYTIKEDVKQGFDVVVSIKLKQYQEFKTKVFKISQDDGVIETLSIKRETKSAPTPKKAKTYTVVKGDTLWAIAKRNYGNGSKYNIIYDANRDKIQNPNSIRVGQVITIPAI